MTAVVHSCTSNSFSGLEGYVLDLVDWQNRAGKPVELFCREGSQLEIEARRRGIRLWTISQDDRYGPRLWLKLRKEWARRLSNGPVTLHMHAGGEPWFHFPWLSRVKSILHYHIWINHGKRDPLHRVLFSRLHEVWTSSESSRAHLSALLPIEAKRIRVVPYGREVKRLRELPVAELRAQARARFGIGSDDILGVCIARLERIKGVGELFDAFTIVAPKHPRAQLLIVGDASPNNPEAAKFAEGLRAKHAALDSHIQKRLLLPGYVSPSELVLAAGDFYVLPSYEECMSLAMLDALILGLPIIGTNAGGTPSVARPDETGALVPPADVKALAEVLDRFYGNPEDFRRLRGGARVLGESFDREEIFQKIWAWYAS